MGPCDLRAFVALAQAGDGAMKTCANTLS